jgi:hypothetical protein
MYLTPIAQSYFGTGSSLSWYWLRIYFSMFKAALYLDILEKVGVGWKGKVGEGGPKALV